MTDDQIRYMVNRFLGWRLPENFSPDDGISFQPEYNVEYNAARGLPPSRRQPGGTNLFDAAQAEAMIRYMAEGMPLEPVREMREEAALDRALRDVAGNLRSLITDNSTTEVDRLLRDASELIRVLARMATGGKTLYQAFGAPGDWGYETPIGSALNALYSRPRQS